MKVALDARMLTGYTGIERYLRGLLDELPRVPGLDLMAVVQPDDVGELARLAPTVRPVVVPAPPFSPGEQLSLVTAVRRCGADLVHFAAPNAPLAAVGPRVTTFHDLTLVDHPDSAGAGVVPQAKLRVFRAVMARGAASSRVLLTPSEATARRLVAQFPRAAGRVRVTPLGAPPLAATADVTRQPLLLHVGNAYPYKNLDRLLAGFAALQEHRPELRLTLAGPTGAQRDHLAGEAARRGVEAAVDLPGRVSDEELVGLYQRAAVFVLPSLSEGFGLPALEAMSHGTPVAAARATSLPEVCGDAAVYFDPSDVASLTDAVGRLLDDDPARARLAAAGRARAAGFSWRTTAELTAEAYRAALR